MSTQKFQLNMESLFALPPLAGHVPLTGVQLRDSGIESVLSNTSQEWKDKLRNRVAGFPSGYTFTMESVVESIGGRPGDTHPNCVGALTHSFVKKGLMRRTGRLLKAERVSRHRADAVEWERT